MDTSIEKILSALTPLGAGLDSTRIEKFEQRIDFCFPTGYKEFLSLANGASGSIDESVWIHFYPIEEVIAGKDAYNGFLPNYVQIGSNGSSTGYFWHSIHSHDSEGSFIQIDLYDLEKDTIEFSAPSFSELLTHLTQTQ